MKKFGKRFGVFFWRIWKFLLHVISFIQHFNFWWRCCRFPKFLINNQIIRINPRVKIREYDKSWNIQKNRSDLKFPICRNEWLEVLISLGNNLTVPNCTIFCLWHFWKKKHRCVDALERNYRGTPGSSLGIFEINFDEGLALPLTCISTFLRISNKFSLFISYLQKEAAKIVLGFDLIKNQLDQN